jgi:hypothetical protein
VTQSLQRPELLKRLLSGRAKLIHHLGASFGASAESADCFASGD